MSAPLVPVVVRAALAGALVCALAACGSGEEPAPDPVDTAAASSSQDPATSSPGAAPAELALPGASSAKCALPSAGVLAEADTALAGTVVAVDGRRVTMEVARWYRGGDGAATVELMAPDLGMVALDSVEFEVGADYLVAAQDGRVMICGYSGPSSPELVDLFAQVFGS